jgi:hypothetical protein
LTVRRRRVTFPGEPIFTSAQLGEVMRFNAPIAAKGRVYVAGNAEAYAFTVR